MKVLYAKFAEAMHQMDYRKQSTPHLVSREIGIDIVGRNRSDRTVIQPRGLVGLDLWTRQTRARFPGFTLTGQPSERPLLLLRCRRGHLRSRSWQLRKTTKQIPKYP